MRTHEATISDEFDHWHCITVGTAWTPPDRHTGGRHRSRPSADEVLTVARRRLAMPTHEQWVHGGDVMDELKHRAVVVVGLLLIGVVVAAVAAFILAIARPAQAATLDRPQQVNALYHELVTGQGGLSSPQELLRLARGGGEVQR